MTSVTNPYETLYTNLKNRFTVICEGSEYSVGDYMLMKANKKNQQKTTSSLPVQANTSYEHSALVNIAQFVNERLTVKNPPRKDKTIKRFPFKTSFSAVLSAVAACALVVSCGIIGFSNFNSKNSVMQDTTDYGYTQNYETPDTVGENNAEINAEK